MHLYATMQRVYKSSLLALLLILFSCDIPRDSKNSFKKAKQKGLIVAYQENPPWAATAADGAPEGVEVELIKDFARFNNFRIKWKTGLIEEIMSDLTNYKTNVAIGGIKKNSLWRKKAAFSVSWAITYGDKGEKEERVLAVSPGENKLLHKLDQFILQKRERFKSE